jgi:WD40 repeat protein
MAEALRGREGKLSVFISYSRDDLDFADELETMLSLAGFAPTLDRHGIHGGEEWQARLGALIRDAEAIVFVLSPASATSRICSWEVDEAVRLGKRIIPVVCKPIETTNPPPQLRALNYIYFYRNPKKPDSGFRTGTRELIDALHDIPQWLLEHTRLLRLASDWEAAGRATNRLLSGSDVAKAKSWIAERPTGQPPPSEQQLDYIRASEEAEAIRKNTEHQRLKEMEAVQNARETAIKDKEAAQKERDAEAREKEWRTYGWAATAVAAAAVVAAVVYFTGRDRELRIQATSEQNQLAARLTFKSDQAIRDADPATGLLLALEVLPDTSSKVPTERERAMWPDAVPVLENAGRKLRERAVLAGHSEIVSSVAVTPNGSHIVSASLDNTVRVWDADTRRSNMLTGHTDRVTSLAVSPDGTVVVTGSDDGTMRVWNIASGKLAIGPMGQDSSIVDVAMMRNGDHVVSAASDKTIRVWNIKTGTPIGEPYKLTRSAGITSIAVSPTGNRVVVGSYDNSAWIVDLVSREVVAQLQGHSDTVTSVAFAAIGERIITGSADGTVRIWEPRSVAGRTKVEWRQALELSGNAGRVTRVAVTDDGTRVVSAFGTGDNSIKIWDAETGRELAVIKGHIGEVHGLAVTRDGARIASGSSDNTVRLWDATTTVEMKGHKGPIYGVAVSPDGEYIVTVAWDDPSARDRALARVWSARTGSEKAAFRDHQADINAVVVMPDSEHVATASDDGTVRIWETRTGEETLVLRGHTGFVLSIAVSSDGKLIATGSGDKTAIVWDAKTGSRLDWLEGHSGPVQSVAFSRDLRHIVTGSADNTARIWKLNAENGSEHGRWRPFATLAGHQLAVLSVAVTQDNRVVTGSHDDTVRIWDLATGKQIGAPLSGHADSVMSVAVTPDDNYIVTGSADTTARIWNAKTGKEVTQLRGQHTQAVTSVAVTPDGKKIVTGSLDRTARTWAVESTRDVWDVGSKEKLVALAKKVAPRCLTPTERVQHGLSLKSPSWCGELDKWPYDPVGGLVEGTRLLGIGEAMLADRLFEALEHHPGLSDQVKEARASGHLRYGTALLNAKRDDDANRQFELAKDSASGINARVDAAWATAHVDRGKKLLNAGAEEEAAVQFRLALDRDPGSAKRTNAEWAEAYIRLGGRRIREGEELKAQDHFNRARGLDPSKSSRIETIRADAHFDRGYNLRKKWDDGASQAQFELALKYDPTDAMKAKVLNAIAWQWYVRKQPEKGLRDAEEAVKLRPDAGMILDQGDSIHHIG